jgi:hypothetical protein
MVRLRRNYITAACGEEDGDQGRLCPSVVWVRERKEGNIWLPFAAWRHANEGGVMQ